MNNKMLSVTQVKSDIGRLEAHKACLRGLGIMKMGRTVDVVLNSENLGMIKKISYMLKVQEKINALE